MSGDPQTTKAEQVIMEMLDDLKHAGINLLADSLSDDRPTKASLARAGYFVRLAQERGRSFFNG